MADNRKLTKSGQDKMNGVPNVDVKPIEGPKRAAAELTFVTEEDGQWDYWSIVPTGEFAQDCRMGRDIADELIIYMRATEDTMILDRVQQSMCAERSDGAVRTGFWSRIAELTILGKTFG